MRTIDQRGLVISAGVFGAALTGSGAALTGLLIIAGLASLAFYGWQAYDAYVSVEGRGRGRIVQSRRRR